LPEYAEEWCANLRLGTDEKLSTKGVARHRPLYRFSDVADSMKWQCRFDAAVRAAISLKRHVASDAPRGLLSKEYVMAE